MLPHHRLVPAVSPYEDNLGTMGRSEDPARREEGGPAVVTAVLALDTHLPGPAVRHGLLTIVDSLQLWPVRADGGLTAGPGGART